MRKHKRSWIVLYTLTTALAVLAAGWFLNSSIRNGLKQNLLTEYGNEEQLVAGQVAQQLVTDVAGVKDKLNIIATIPEVKSGSVSACNAKLAEQFKILESKVGNLGRIDKNGIFRCSLNSALIGVPGAKLGSYIPQIFNDPAHLPVLSRAFVPPGSKSYISALHVPVYDDRKTFDGTLGGAIYFDQIQSKYLKDITFAKNGFAILVDDNGDILYHPKRNLIGKNLDSPEIINFLSQNVRTTIKKAAKDGSSGQVRYFGGGVEKLAAYTSANLLPGHRWIVLVTVPVTDADAALGRVGLDQGFMAFSLVLTLAIILIAGAMLLGRLKSLEVDQAKDEFLSLATHQLLTPISGVSMNLELILGKEPNLGKLNKVQREVVQDAFDSNQRQLRIVDDLLNVARIDSGRMRLKPIELDLTDLITHIVKEQQSVIDSRGQTVSLELVPVRARFDPARLRMALENLLSNASKYTPKGGQIQILLSEDSQHVQIQIQDNGVGIPEKDIKKLFRKFSRVDNPLSEEVGGSGLGLYLVKRIVDLHSGNISVKSVVGKGTAFVIHLPRNL